MLNINIKIKVHQSVLLLVVFGLMTTSNFVLSGGSAKAQEDSQSNLNNINKLVSDSKYNEAIEKLKVLIQKEPRNSKFHFALGTIYQKTGNLDEALYEFDLSERLSLGETVDLRSPKTKEKNNISLSNSKENSQKEDSKENQPNYQNSSKRMFAGAYGYYIQGKYDDAIEKYLMALELDPSNYQGCFELGQVYQDIGDIKNATKYFEKAIYINPDFISPYKKLAFIKATSGDVTRAISLYEKVISQDLKDSKAFYALSKLYRENNQLEKSYNSLLNAYKIDPGNSKIYNELKSLAQELGKSFSSISNNTSGQFNTNENIENLLSKANNYLKNKDLDSSVEYYKKALLIDPNNLKAKTGLSSAMSLLAKDFWDKGYQEYSQKLYIKSLEYDSYNLESIEPLANIYKANKDYNNAIKYMKIYLDKAYNKDIAFNLANLYDNSGDKKQYISSLEQIYNVDKKYKNISNILADYYLANNDEQKAINYLENSLETSPSIDVAKKIADIYFKNDNLVKAKYYYEKVLSINNNDFHSLKAKGMIELYTNQSNKALEYLSKAADINNKDYQLFFEIAKIQQEKNDLQNALKNFNKAIQLNPKFSQAYYLAGLIYKNQNNIDLAKDYLNKVSLLDPNNPDVSIILSEMEKEKVISITTKNQNKEVVEEKQRISKHIFTEDEKNQPSIPIEKKEDKQNKYIPSDKASESQSLKEVITVVDHQETNDVNINKTKIESLKPINSVFETNNEDKYQDKQLKSQIKVNSVIQLDKNTDEKSLNKDENASKVSSNNLNKPIDKVINDNYNASRVNEDKTTTTIPVFIADDEDYSAWSRNNATYNKISDNKSHNTLLEAEKELNTGNYLLAIDIAMNLISINPSEKAFFILGKAYYYKKDYSKSIEYIKKASESNPINVEYKVLLSKALYKENYYLEALRILTNLPENNLNTSEIKSLIGDIYYSQDNYTEALTYYEKALDAPPLTNENIVKLGNTYNKLGRYNDSVNLLLKSILSGFISYDIYYNLVIAYKNLRNPDKAQHYLSKAIEIEPDNSNNSMLKSELEKFALNSESYKTSTNSDKNPANTEYNKAYEDITNGKLTDAIEKYNEILKSNPDSIDAYYNLGTAHKKLGQYEEAIYNYKQALKLNPKDKDILVNLGTTYIETGDYSKASNTLYNAIQYDPNDATAYSFLGITYFKKGYYEDALKSFTRSTELKGNSLSNLYNIGMCYTKLKDKRMAETFYQKAFNVRPVTMEDQMVLASIYKELSLFSKAKSIYDKIIREYPTNILPRYKLIQLYEITSKYNEMNKEIQNLLKIDSDSKIANLAKQKLKYLNNNN